MFAPGDRFFGSAEDRGSSARAKYERIVLSARVGDNFIALIVGLRIAAAVTPNDNGGARQAHGKGRPMTRPQTGQEPEVTMTGTIRTIRVDKGFGFIKDEAGQEYFFHRSAVYGEGLEDLREGDSVEFDVGQGPKGPRAENVRRTST